MTRVIAIPAPALMPNMPESARGFRVKLCSNKPERASDPPPMQAAKILGSLMLVMIKVIAAVDFPKRTLITSNGDMLESPIDREMIIKQTSRSEEHTSELQSRQYLVCRLLLEKKN